MGILMVKKVDIEKKKGPEPGIYITRTNESDKVMGFQGSNFEAQLTPTGDIVVVELVPDIGNENDGHDVSKIRRFIAAGTWEDVVVIE